MYLSATFRAISRVVSARDDTVGRAWGAAGGAGGRFAGSCHSPLGEAETPEPLAGNFSLLLLSFIASLISTHFAHP
jgi:hypothetical protein